jgi:hypothetical protein
VAPTAALRDAPCAIWIIDTTLDQILHGRGRQELRGRERTRYKASRVQRYTRSISHIMQKWRTAAPGSEHAGGRVPGTSAVYVRGHPCV